MNHFGITIAQAHFSEADKMPGFDSKCCSCRVEYEVQRGVNAVAEGHY